MGGGYINECESDDCYYNRKRRSSEGRCIIFETNSSGDRTILCDVCERDENEYKDFTKCVRCSVRCLYNPEMAGGLCNGCFTLYYDLFSDDIYAIFSCEISRQSQVWEELFKKIDEAFYFKLYERSIAYGIRDPIERLQNFEVMGDLASNCRKWVGFENLLQRWKSLYCVTIRDAISRVQSQEDLLLKLKRSSCLKKMVEQARNLESNEIEVFLEEILKMLPPFRIGKLERSSNLFDELLDILDVKEYLKPAVFFE